MEQRGLGRAIAGERCRAKYSLGVFRTNVWQLGTSKKNRAVSDKYAHCLGRRIADVEGFSRARYKNGLCMQPNPDDPHECYRHHCEVVARSAGRLAPPRQRELDEMLWKNHLVLWIQAMDSGVVQWDDTGKLMALKDCKVSQPEFLDTIKHGMYVEKLDYVAWQEDREGVEALISVDNLDQAFSLAEHEMALLRSYVEAACGCKPGPGMTHWDACYQTVTKQSAGAWTEEDHIAAYNFAKDIDPSRFNALSTLHFHFVNPQQFRIPAEYFNLVRRVPKKFGWLRCALLAHAYNVREMFWVKTGTKIMAKGLMPKAIDTLSKSEAKMATLDNFLKQTVAGKIGVRQPDCEYEVLRGSCNALHKIGRVANRNTDLEAQPKAIGEIECEYRAVLRKCDYALAPMIWAGTEELETALMQKEKKTAAASQKKDAITPTVDGPTEFQDGDVVEEEKRMKDLAKRGIQVGAQVHATRDVEITGGRGDWKATTMMVKGSKASIRQLHGTKATIVLEVKTIRRFHTEAYQNSPELTEVAEMTVPVSSIAVPGVDGPEKKEKEPREDEVPEGTAWRQITEEQMLDVYGSYVVSAAASLEGSLGASKGALDIMAGTDEIVAKKTFPPKTLQLFPFATELSRRPLIYRFHHRCYR